MASRSVLIPTYLGHLDQVTALVNSIRRAGNSDISIALVIAASEKKAFAPLAQSGSCQLLEIDSLVRLYSGAQISAETLLAAVGRFRFQALKKLLGVASLAGEVLVLDSESHIRRDLSGIFEGGIGGTSVVFSERPWQTMSATLTTDVYSECCELLGPQPYWYFESFNWLYSSELTRELLEHLKSAHGADWIFRPRPLFESQLYFQYARSRDAGYRFVPAIDILGGHFGRPRAEAILRAVYTSPRAAFGIFEYLARFVSRQEYADFVRDAAVTPHFRIMRHEPYEFYDVVSMLEPLDSDPNYFGEAAMHRRPLLSGKIAVLIAGRFHDENDVYNMRQFLRGVDCDVFLGVSENFWLDALARDVLRPVHIAVAPEGNALGKRHLALSGATGLPEREIKTERDIGSMAMFDKIARAWTAMRAHESAEAKPYSLVVRVRPDIYASRGLRDVLWDISENVGSLKAKLFFPDRFWSQGINDQIFLGLRQEMGVLLDRLGGTAYANARYRNPEHFLGVLVRELELQPVAFPFEYLLTRGAQPDLHDVGPRFAQQQSVFWSGPATARLWHDSGSILERTLKNVELKNGRLVLQKVQSRRATFEVGYVTDCHGRRHMLISELKSSAVYLLSPGRLALPFVRHALAFGVLRPQHGREVGLRSYDAENGKLLLEWIAEDAGIDNFPAPPTLGLFTTIAPPRFIALALARRLRNALRSGGRGLRKMFLR